MHAYNFYKYIPVETAQKLFTDTGVCNQARVINFRYNGISPRWESREGVVSGNRCSELTPIHHKVEKRPRGFGPPNGISPLEQEGGKECGAEQGKPEAESLLEPPELSPTHIPSSPWLIGGWDFSRQEVGKRGNEVYHLPASCPNLNPNCGISRVSVVAEL